MAIPKGLRQRAYGYIKEKILSCAYAPGSFINETMVQEEIGVSRTPIREALGLLEQEGLVRILPKKGTYITDLTIADLTVIYETRALIEPYILRTYHENLDLSRLLPLRERFLENSLSRSSFYETDDEFHGILQRACTNYVLVRALEQTYVQNERVRILSGELDQRISQSNREHIDIIDRLLAEDHEGAAQAMAQHLEQSKRAAFSRLISNGGWKLPTA